MWLPESRGRNALVHSSWLLANTQKLVVATGIANIYARDPMAMANGQRALAEQSDGRFLLGVGVSHRPMVEGLRGHTYGKPVATMRAYLKAMREAPYAARGQPRGDAADRRRGARAADDGAVGRAWPTARIPTMSIPAHTAEARKILGPGKLLAPRGLGIARKRSGEGARRAAARRCRTICSSTITSTTGAARVFGDADLAGGGSDRFIDAIVAWGDEAAIRKRIQEHWDAGADHVCIQPISPDGGREVDERVLELLAPTPAILTLWRTPAPTLFARRSRRRRSPASRRPAERGSSDMYSETTRSIKVTVKPFYLEDHSSPADGHYVWAYHVRIENRGDETVQLRRRHWQITDSRGQVQEVRGPGVVGEQPVLGPGRELRIHQQQPAADAVRHHGRQLRDGDARRREFSVRIPAFSLDSPQQPVRLN